MYWRWLPLICKGYEYQSLLAKSNTEWKFTVAEDFKECRCRFSGEVGELIPLNDSPRKTLKYKNCSNMTQRHNNASSKVGSGSIQPQGNGSKYAQLKREVPRYFQHKLMQNRHKLVHKNSPECKILRV